MNEPKEKPKTAQELLQSVPRPFFNTPGYGGGPTCLSRGSYGEIVFGKRGLGFTDRLPRLLFPK